MTTILLIRHGESEANRLGFFAGQTDVALEEKGLEQAKITADFIARTYQVDAVYASDLRRAYDTGLATAQLVGQEVRKEPRMREIYAGQWQGLAFDQIVARYAQDYNLWLHDIGNSVCTDGESVAQLSGRIMEALEEIARENEGKTVVIATHATPIRVVQCLLSGYPLGEMKKVPWVSNASVTELSWENGVWKLEKIGQDAHLANLKTVFPANV